MFCDIFANLIWIKYFILPTLLSFFITLFLIPLVIKFAFRFNIVDKPDYKIKSHKVPVAYLGGFSVFLGFLFSILFFLSVNISLFFFILGLFFLVILGLIDDIFILKPSTKFFAQVFYIPFFLFTGFIEPLFSGLLYSLFSFLFILTYVNAFNLVDVMDGLSSSLAISSLLSLIVIGLLTSNLNLVIVSSSLLGALISFFIFNRAPAKIYLGDSGSLFLGGFFGSIVFLVKWDNLISDSSYFIAPFLILLVPFLELISLIIIRTFKGIPFFRGSRDHYSLYFFDLGFSKSKIVAASFIFSLIWQILVIGFLIFDISLFYLLPCLIALYLFWFYFCLFFKNVAFYLKQQKNN